MNIPGLPAHTVNEEPVNGLRFVLRGERRILQQAWVIREGHVERYEWRDVPLIEEETDGAS